MAENYRPKTRPNAYGLYALQPRCGAMASADLRRVTPRMAAGWLGQLSYTTHPQKVQAMASAMQNGRWPQQPTEIILSRAGRVINGAHRLSALILAKATLPFFIRVED